MSIESIKLALDALERCVGTCFDQTITALRQAIDEAEQAQPVAWMVYTLDGNSVCVTDNPTDFTEQHRALPLYTSPPPRQPLTDEMDKQALLAYPVDERRRMAFIDGWFSAEAAHGIGSE